MAEQGSVLAGLGAYLLIAAVPTLLFWVLPRVVARAWGRVADWREARAPERPTGPSIERLAADLRRLRHEMRCAPPTTQVRRVALQTAYDQALLDTCRAVGVDDAPLAGASERDRAFARLLTEAAVEAAGVRLDPPTGGRTAA